MFDFFKPSRDKGDRTDSQADQPASTLQPESQTGASTESAFSNRDVIRIVLRDTLRRNGIPTDWIASQIASRAHAGQPTTHQIQLLILKWHEGFLRFAPLLQQQILQGLRQFDPQGDYSNLSVVWSFAPGCGCPYTSMPDPSYWSAAGAKKFDLPASSRKFHDVDDDFATTVPSALN